MRRTQVLAVALGVAVAVEALVSVLLALYADWNWATYVDTFTFSNGLIGVSFGLSGAVIAYYRPHNTIGWILASGGFVQAMSAVVLPTGALVHGVAQPGEGVGGRGHLVAKITEGSDECAAHPAVVLDQQQLRHSGPPSHAALRTASCCRTVESPIASP
jgi:hypothetical protein